MGRLDELRDAIIAKLREANPAIEQGDFDRIIGDLEARIASEPPPRIAVIGEAGVGKSSTLNALFNAGLEISHTEACTQEAAEIRVPLRELQADGVSVDTVLATEGELIVYDMPGLGESLAKREDHISTYDAVLGRVDATLWILDAPDRGIEFAQGEMARLDKRLTRHMTIALNKVDTVHPGETAWYVPANLPLPEQEQNIQLRIRDVEAKVREALPHWEGAIVGYSATRRYNLPQLFARMLDGVARERRWVLTQRKSLADFLELVDPGLLPASDAPATSGPDLAPLPVPEALLNAKPGAVARDVGDAPVQPVSAPDPEAQAQPRSPAKTASAGEALDELTPAQYASVTASRESLSEWLRGIQSTNVEESS